MLTLDFQEAFDKISHQYLFAILRSQGVSAWFIDRIKDLCENATASVQINGHLAGAIPIQCAVRQGCPMSKLLYVLCLNLFLRLLEKNLPGFQIGRRARRTTVVAYADDITIFVTSPTDFPIIHDAIRLYERA
jgi:hypothetical protein